MQRITISLDDDTLEALNRICERRGYASRSEALRDIIRMNTARLVAGGATGALDDEVCFATLSYVYDHHTRDLARRLTDNQHDHYDLSVSTTHVHVDPQSCLEVAILHGPVASLQSFADSVVSQRGVRYGSLHIVPVDGSRDDHAHPHEPKGKAGKMAR